MTSTPGRSAAPPDRTTLSDDGPLAEVLGATGVEQAMVVLPSTRRMVQLPVYLRSEKSWAGELPREFGTIPNKPAYTLDGAPTYPELLVVRLLEKAGWGAAWRKTWNGVAYWRDINEKVEPSALAMSIIGQVTRQAGYEGSWDIVAWRDRELRLLFSRTPGGQRVSAYAADWLDAALRMGIPLGCFAVVEHHSVSRPAKRRR